MPCSFVFENDDGTWSLLSQRMDAWLSTLHPKGISTYDIYSPTHGVTSHLDAGMGGNRRWLQYNLKTGRVRLLSRICWNSPTDLAAALRAGWMIVPWRESLSHWIERDLRALREGRKRFC